MHGARAMQGFISHQGHVLDASDGMMREPTVKRRNGSADCVLAVDSAFAAPHQHPTRTATQRLADTLISASFCLVLYSAFAWCDGFVQSPDTKILEYVDKLLISVRSHLGILSHIPLTLHCIVRFSSESPRQQLHKQPANSHRTRQVTVSSK